MSKTKSKKKKNNGSKKVKPADVAEVPVEGEAEDEMSSGEKFLMASKPYWAHIALGVLAVIFASVLWNTFKMSSLESKSQPWRDLNNAMTQAGLTSDVSSLKEMAENNDGTAAGQWGLLLAGDNEVNRGIDMLARDRVGGLKLIQKGVDSLQKVVDAPANTKTPMVQRRSLFRLASAQEALGEFEAAKNSYQKILDDAPDSPWAAASKRGVARCSNPDMVAIYDKFRNWEEATEAAPGPLVPDKPVLNFDDIKLPEGEASTFTEETKKEEPESKSKDDEAEAEAKSEVTEDASSVEMPKEEEAVKEEAAKEEAADAAKEESAADSEPESKETEAPEDQKSEAEAEGEEASESVEGEGEDG